MFDTFGSQALQERVESGDGEGDTWSTVGVDENIIAASWHALEEAVTYCLLRAGRDPS